MKNLLVTHFPYLGFRSAKFFLEAGDVNHQMKNQTRSLMNLAIITAKRIDGLDS